MSAPIVMFAYNRLEHLQRSLHTLEQADGAQLSDMYIFADGFKGEKDKKAVCEVQAFLKEYQNNCKAFSKVYLSCSEVNNGLAKSVIAGVSQVIQKYGSVIVLEDDLIVAKDFLHYMNQALTHYKDNMDVFQISGWTPNADEIRNYTEDTFLWYRANSWGWATWEDRWNKVDWSMRDYRSFRFNPIKRHKFNCGGADMADMLDMQMQGKINSWAIRFAYAVSLNNSLVVYPRVSLITNCGQDGSGTHSHRIETSTFKDTVTKSVFDEENLKWGDRLVRKDVEKIIYRYYSGSWIHCLKWQIKSLMNRMGIKQF